jgi:tocopherol cyclase
MIHKLYHPEIFQGSVRKKHYFEGWYFKHISPDQAKVISFIPGISIDGHDTHAFVQVLNGITGNSSYIRYPINEFKWNRKKMNFRIGTSEFTPEYIRLDIVSDGVSIGGQIEYRNSIKYPGSLISPGIMGWYSFVPFMECNHGIVSVLHDLSGKISINGEFTDFTGGKGYSEKDWGVSFPECWIWIQSCNFPERDVSFCFSVAKIPWLGSHFTGFICFIYLMKRFFLFSTYNGSVIERVQRDKEKIGIALKNKKHHLEFEVRKNSFGELAAPVSGKMSRLIRESIDSEVVVRLSEASGNLIYSGKGEKAGFEIEEKIFDYLIPDSPPAEQP